MTQGLSIPIHLDEFRSGNRPKREAATRPAWGYDEWYEHLSQPGRHLVELNALTEDRFLQFGRFLNDFHRRAGTISDLAAQIRDQLIGDDASGGIASLQLLVERMSIFLHDIRSSSERNEASLTALCGTLERLHRPLQAFQRITKTLQVVGITTRVECSGFSDGQNNVTHLSDSIRRLGSLIAVNMNEIIDQVAALHGLSKEALRNESALNNGQSERAQVAVTQARSVLAHLVENRNRALQQSESLTQSSKAVAQSIAEIVSSIQFHDITRQQIEHVTEALDSFRDAIMASFREGAKIDRAALELEIAEGCRLQAEQLTHSGNELSAAVWRIVESLHALSTCVTELVDDTRSLGGDTERDGLSFFEAIEPAIASVAALLSENLSTAAQSARAVNEVVAAAEAMARLVEEIERFGAEMKVIALNASIESVHVKSGGTSLGVIADSIQELAREALLQTDELAGGLHEITLSANELNGMNPAGATGHDGKVESLVEDSEVRLAELHQANATLLARFAEMDRQSEVLATDIARVAGSIQVHREAGEIISGAAEALNQIIRRFDLDKQTPTQRAGSELFSAMRQRYSMKSEREIHDRLAGKTVPKTGRKEPAADNVEKRPDHGLGANVELF